MVDATAARPGNRDPTIGFLRFRDTAVITDGVIIVIESERHRRSIEGIPQGDLDKYIFYPDDPEWEDSVPAGIPSMHRRVTATCYSWPGVHPEACMELYGRQLEPLLPTLLTRPYADLSLSGDFFERALARAKLPEF